MDRRRLDADRVLCISRIVWECTLKCRHLPHRTTDEEVFDSAVSLMAVAEALFPLVALACKKVSSENPSQSTYFSLECAGAAGSRACVTWILSHKPHRAINKECLAVLWGLCGGGHLELAMKLAGSRRGSNLPPVSIGGETGTENVDNGSNRSETEGWAGLKWCGDDDDEFVQEVRSIGNLNKFGFCSLLHNVCGNGHLDVAKWVVSRFGMKEPWEFADSLARALHMGQLEVAQWLIDTVPLKDLQNSKHADLLWCACHSGKVEVAEWLEANFPDAVEARSSSTIWWFTRQKNITNTNLIKMSQWLEDRSISKADLQSIYNEEVVKWAVDFYGITVAENDLIHSVDLGNLCLTKWYVLEKNVSPTPAVFIAACGNFVDEVPVVRWLSTRLSFPLTQQYLRHALFQSLRSGNIRIANWLEENFRITSQDNDFMTSPTTTIGELCKEAGADGAEKGIKWFLQHSTKGILWCEEEAARILEISLRKNEAPVQLLLLDTFGPAVFPYNKHRDLMKRILRETVFCGLPKIQSLISTVGPDFFTKAEVAESLTNDNREISSKSAKWLITQFGLAKEHVTRNNHILLWSMLSHRHNKCAEWLIRTFNICLREMHSPPVNILWGNVVSTDLETWKVLLRVFPTELTPQIVKKRFSKFVIASPITAQFVMQHFPGAITTEEISQASSSCPFHFVTLETCCWVNSLRSSPGS
ncbi:hypothetical protein Pelo_7902 [Pelomyxa schiedti]|nr:hypothetical protein Pelo_7902 [Pelomyxa schiedti]